MPPHGVHVEKNSGPRRGFFSSTVCFCFVNIGVERFVLHECPPNFLGGGVFGFDSWLVCWTAPLFSSFLRGKKRGVVVLGCGEVYRTVHQSYCGFCKILRYLVLAGVCLSVGAAPLALEYRSFLIVSFGCWFLQVRFLSGARLRPVPVLLWGRADAFVIPEILQVGDELHPYLVAQRELLLSSPALWTAEIVASP